MDVATSCKSAVGCRTIRYLVSFSEIGATSGLPPQIEYSKSSDFRARMRLILGKMLYFGLKLCLKWNEIETLAGTVGFIRGDSINVMSFRFS